MDEDASPDDDGDAPVPRPSWKDRLTQPFVKPAAPKAEPAGDGQEERPLTDAEVKSKITLLDATERKVGNAAAGLAAAILLISTLPYLDNPKPPVKTDVSPQGKTCPTNFKYQKV